MTWYREKHRTFFVYLLLEDDGEVRYVGLTTDPTRRKYVHYVTSRQHYRGDTPLRRWLEARRVRDLPLHMLLVEKVVGLQRARIREVAWIDLYHAHGCALLNTTGLPRQARLL